MKKERKKESFRENIIIKNEKRKKERKKERKVFCKRKYEKK